MKKRGIELIIFGLSILFMGVSCRKERELRDLIGGKTWVLQSGRVYVEELDAPYNKRYYDHFGVGQEYSNLQAFDSVSLSIDSLIQHYTSWSFNSRFVLNAIRTYDYEIVNDKFIVLLPDNLSEKFEWIKKKITYRKLSTNEDQTIFFDYLLLCNFITRRNKSLTLGKATEIDLLIAQYWPLHQK
jgi:hypothetical protein